MDAALTPAPATARSDSRRLVLDQAARLFRERGYAETSLRDIAAACGMKTASLYYHFPSKEDIVAAVLNTGIANVAEEVRRRLATIGPAAPPADRLRAAISGHLHALLELDDFTGANIRIFGHVPPRVRAVTMPQRESYEQLWRDLLADVAAQGAIRPGTDLRLLRLLLLGAMNWAVEWHKPRRNQADSVAAIADGLADLALHGCLDTAGAPAARARPATARRG